MSFTFFDRTGDIGVDLAGQRSTRLFADASAAFTDAVVDRAAVCPTVTRRVELEHEALDLLLVEWLGE